MTKTAAIDKNSTLKAAIKAICDAQDAYGKVEAMRPSIKAAKITREELSEALKVAWKFADMQPKSKEYNNTKVKVSYWLATIFNPKKKKPAAPAKPVKVSEELTNKFIEWLMEQNISAAKVKATALALANNIA